MRLAAAAVSLSVKPELLTAGAALLIAELEAPACRMDFIPSVCIDILTQVAGQLTIEQQAPAENPANNSRPTSSADRAVRAASNRDRGPYRGSRDISPGCAPLRISLGPGRPRRVRTAGQARLHASFAEKPTIVVMPIVNNGGIMPRHNPAIPPDEAAVAS